MGSLSIAFRPCRRVCLSKLGFTWPDVRYPIDHSQRQDEPGGGHKLITGKEWYRWESGGQT